jgi:hypothetical protein
MRAKLWNVLAIFGVMALSGARIDAAEAASIVMGTPYQELRPQLLAEGWKPNTGYGLKLANGKPMHRFPEVLCGMEQCRAKWRDASGAERAIMLNRGGPTDDYRVAQ